MVTNQRYGRKLAMSDAELDEFLAAERTCRVGTVSPDGTPHVTPLWFVWHDRAVWLYSLVRSKRWKDIQRGGGVSVVVDAGQEFAQLRGVELVGTAEAVGELPRTGEPVAELDEPERLFAAKYTGGGQPGHDGRHGWLKVTPHTVRSWDHRKIG